MKEQEMSDLRSRVEHRYTGNRTHDLLGFRPDEFEAADAIWHEVAMKRHCSSPRLT